MKTFENTLKKASERYILSEYSEKVCFSFSQETLENVENILTNHSLRRKNMNRKSLTKCLIAAILGAFLLSSAVCAGVPEIRERFTSLLSDTDSADSVWYENLHTVCEYFDAAEEEASPEIDEILGQAIQYFENAEP